MYEIVTSSEELEMEIDNDTCAINGTVVGSPCTKGNGMILFSHYSWSNQQNVDVK